MYCNEYNGSFTKPKKIVSWLKTQKDALYCKCTVKKPIKEIFKKARHSEFETILSKNDPWTGNQVSSYLSNRHPNFPVSFATKDAACDMLPSIFQSINWVSQQWQEFRLSATLTYYIYSAIYDNRTTIKHQSSIRILTYTNSHSEDIIFCQLWYNKVGPPVVTKVINKSYISWIRKPKERFRTYLLTCPVGTPSLRPAAVSLTLNQCDTATNLIRVVGQGSIEGKFTQRLATLNKNQNSSEGKPKIGVNLPRIAICGPALYYYFYDFSIRLIEWIELMRLLGVSAIILYETKTHPNIEKVLRFYENQKDGFVRILDFCYPTPHMDNPVLREFLTTFHKQNLFHLESIYFNDCILRFMDEFRYIAHFDPDEVPILHSIQSMPNLVNWIKKIIGKRPFPSYIMQWKYFHNDLPPGASIIKNASFLNLLRHNQIRLLKGAYKSWGKSIYDMKYVTAAHTHRAMWCDLNKCSGAWHIPRGKIFLGHFRECEQQCQRTETIEDNFLQTFKIKLEQRVKEVINKSGIYVHNLE